MASTSQQTPKEKILEAAEAAFANFGFDGASMRQVMHDAGENLASIYYYFGSKEGLMAAVLKRRFGSLREQHLSLLKGFEQAAEAQPLPVEKILEAILLPPLRLALEAPANRQAIARLIGRIATEPNPQIQAIIRSQHADLERMFEDALARSLPDVPPQELHWRLQFVWGALAFALCNPEQLKSPATEQSVSADCRTLLAKMISFFSPGLQVPATPGVPANA